MLLHLGFLLFIRFTLQGGVCVCACVCVCVCVCVRVSVCVCLHLEGQKTKQYQIGCESYPCGRIHLMANPQITETMEGLLSIMG